MGVLPLAVPDFPSRLYQIPVSARSSLCFLPGSRLAGPSTVSMEIKRSSEMQLVCQTIGRYNPEDGILQFTTHSTNPTAGNYYI
jgi:hypothetical protein